MRSLFTVVKAGKIHANAAEIQVCKILDYMSEHRSSVKGLTLNFGGGCALISDLVIRSYRMFVWSLRQLCPKAKKQLVS